MALTDVNALPAAFDPGRAPRNLRDIPHAALSRLPQLHREAAANLRLSDFLARSPQACLALMAAGPVALAWGGGASLKADFAWSALVLIGVVAMIRNYVRGFARSLRRVPLEETASDLRVLLLYTGTAWAAGAFLVMPELPAPALAVFFAAVPCLAVALVLKEPRGTAAFAAPMSLGVAAAALLGAWPLAGWVAGIILACGGSLVLLSMLQRAIDNRRTAFFAPLP
jgi:hypothetical protein